MATRDLYLYTRTYYSATQMASLVRNTAERKGYSAAYIATVRKRYNNVAYYEYRFTLRSPSMIGYNQTEEQRYAGIFASIRAQAPYFRIVLY